MPPNTTTAHTSLSVSVQRPSTVLIAAGALGLLMGIGGCTCTRGGAGDSGTIDQPDTSVGLDSGRLDSRVELDAHVLEIDAASALPDEGVDAPSQWNMGDGGPGCMMTGEACQPIADGCASTEVCDNGLDDNCDRQIDEGCACVPGLVQGCFAGPPGSRNVGACQDGTQRCQGTGEFGVWGPCMGGISPSAEQCDGLGNDCNGCSDEHECCNAELTCPAPGDPRIPTGRPFQTLNIDGAQFWTGSVRSWSWTITGGPCDQRLPSPTYRTSGLNSPRVSFTPTLSGDYTFTLTVVDSSGMSRTCTFVVHIEGAGLRVELCWLPAIDNNRSDLDLYLHDPRNQDPWFSSVNDVTDPGVVTSASCNWANCAPELRTSAPQMLPRANWGYTDSALAMCEQGPSGALWRAMRICPNPRIDVDGHGAATEPSHGYIENINLDRPRQGQVFRALVHDCRGPASNPILNVYCGGRLRASIGAGGDLVRLPGGRNCSVADTSWRAADITVDVNAAGETTDCTVAPLRNPASAAGFWFSTSQRTY